MNYFLAKTEPGEYSIDDLMKDGTTVWDGVSNPQALRAIREMRPGDRVFIYHSGSQAGVAGLAEVVSEPQPDPRASKLTVVELRFLAQLNPPTPLIQIKSSGLFNDWALVRQGRLSTMAAPQTFVTWMQRRYPDVQI